MGYCFIQSSEFIHTLPLSHCHKDPDREGRLCPGCMAVSVLRLSSHFLDFQDLQTEVHRAIIETTTFHLVLYKIIGFKSHVFDCICFISH